MMKNEVVLTPQKYAEISLKVTEDTGVLIYFDATGRYNVRYESAEQCRDAALSRRIANSVRHYKKLAIAEMLNQPPTKRQQRMHIKKMSKRIAVQPLRPTMHQIVWLCQDKRDKEHNQDRASAYSAILRYIQSQGLRSVDELQRVLNKWIEHNRATTAQIRASGHALSVADQFETQAQVYEEVTTMLQYQ